MDQLGNLQAFQVVQSDNLTCDTNVNLGTHLENSAASFIPLVPNFEALLANVEVPTAESHSNNQYQTLADGTVQNDLNYYTEYVQDPVHMETLGILVKKEKTTKQAKILNSK